MARVTRSWWRLACIVLAGDAPRCDPGAVSPLAKTRRFVYASRDKGFDPEAASETQAIAGPSAGGPT